MTQARQSSVFTQVFLAILCAAAVLLLVYAIANQVQKSRELREDLDKIHREVNR